jgi:hypothetical protein
MEQRVEGRLHRLKLLNRQMYGPAALVPSHNTVVLLTQSGRAVFARECYEKALPELVSRDVSRLWCRY